MNKKLIIILLLIAAFSSCKKEEKPKEAPSISELSIQPETPLAGETVSVLAKVVAPDGLASVKLHYATDGGAYVEVNMTNLYGPEMYSAQIPGQSHGTLVTYYVTATGTDGQSDVEPKDAPAIPATYSIGVPLVLINELFPHGNLADPDWIELYNASEMEADISGYKIFNNAGQIGAKPKKTIPEGSKIPAKGFFVIVVDDETASGFNLSPDGEQIWLENNRENTVDNIIYPASDATQSYGRIPDGKPDWQKLNTITKGAANTAANPAAQLLINEIYSQGTAEFPDWIEIYNNSPFDAELSGWKIYDKSGQEGIKPKKEFAAGAVIQAKGFYVITVDDMSASGFGLSANGETVWLENPDGDITDFVVFPALGYSQSYGRYPDGSENLIIMETVTRGMPNSATVSLPTQVLINEIYSRGTADNPDWIELYNDGDTPYNLRGWKIYDSGGQSGSKPKKELPPNAVIAAKGFYVIVVNDSSASGFGLSSNGEQVWLEKADGSLADVLMFPELSATQSYGRYPDGSESWMILETITKGAPNSNTIPQQTNVVMNEIYSRGTADNPDWIEIYNKGDASVELSGWKIYDNGGQSGSKPKMQFPAGSIIPAKGFFAIVVDDGSEAAFGLSANGEKVWLEKAGGSLADEVQFPALSPSQSFGRYPDGSEYWLILETITKGEPNSNTIPQQTNVVMNEIYSRGTADNPDWIEIYNKGDASVELSGWKIYDNGGQSGSKPKMQFPAGSIIPAKGFFVIVVDDGSEAAFGLSANGEKVWLEKADGSLADEVQFPALSPSQSFGRYPDGSENWMILKTITKGAPNIETKVKPTPF